MQSCELRQVTGSNQAIGQTQGDIWTRSYENDNEDSEEEWNARVRWQVLQKKARVGGRVKS